MSMVGNPLQSTLVDGQRVHTPKYDIHVYVITRACQTLITKYIDSVASSLFYSIQRDACVHVRSYVTAIRTSVSFTVLRLPKSRAARFTIGLYSPLNS